MTWAEICTWAIVYADVNPMMPAVPSLGRQRRSWHSQQDAVTTSISTQQLPACAEPCFLAAFAAKLNFGHARSCVYNVA